MRSDGAKKPYGRKYERAVIQEARRHGFKGYSISVLTALLSFRNYDTGQARPGKKILRELTGASKNTMDKHLKALRDAGLIVAIAYENGGHGSATVYGFGLPAWSGYEQNNHPKKEQQPPQKTETTTPKNGAATERTIRTGNKAGASRPDGDKVRADMSEAQLTSWLYDRATKPRNATYGEVRGRRGAFALKWSMVRMW
ncbi:helix-turn-helix domain-containing protein [Celeribacter baekdonensis]|uniref:Helix-turn-helix domain-containing protein n=1 Tax=Celeribacter baekdonensis TaxID=875171 RepID=A0A2R4M1F2_9RHOB|nr:helix-turn-helix domain-containing protein [Celeribacter baekdonensis]AVW90991.1 hypothetical protein DA792_07745 [Celeribacter baekdonensis]